LRPGDLLALTLAATQGRRVCVPRVAQPGKRAEVNVVEETSQRIVKLYARSRIGQVQLRLEN